MKKIERINEQMTLADAAAYIDNIADVLDKIYQAKKAPSGKAGVIWRTIWGSPRKISPLVYFLAEKHVEQILNGEVDRKQSVKRASEKAKKNLLIVKSAADKEHNELLAMRSSYKLLDTELKKSDVFKEAYLSGHPSDMKKDIAFLLEICKKAGSPVNYDRLKSYRAGNKNK